MHKFILILLKAIGAVALAIGLVAAYYGPLEIFVFDFFSPGGRFYYEGFGFGSFWFAALVVQNLGYYLIAAICLPLGIGHLTLRRWALTLSQLCLWFWLGAGLLLLLNLLALIPAALRLDLSREVLYLRLSLAGVTLLVFLLLLPALGLWFYRSPGVRQVFETHDAKSYWTESYPFPLLALLLLYLMMILAMHLAIFFQAVFPFFGQILLGRGPVYLLSLCILMLGILIYGTFRRKTWAWWGAVVFLALLAISSTLSFSRHSFSAILLMMDLPAYELAFLNRMSLLKDFYLVGLLATPLWVALGLLVFSKRFFGKDEALLPAPR
jgi:hypothetical protein